MTFRPTFVRSLASSVSCAFAFMAALSATVSSAGVYSQHFHDAITGDNEFITSGEHAWFVNTGADSYANDEYERPTVQTYKNSTINSRIGTDSELAALGSSVVAAHSSDPTYFEYLDITRGFYGFDGKYIYLAIELYGDEKVGNNGTRTQDFGESTYYRVRISSQDSDGASGLMVSAEAAADFQKPEFMNFNSQKAMAYLDINRDVGGPGGVTVVNENPGAMNGFENKVISDGKLETVENVLQARRSTSDAGLPLVEFKLNYVEFNGAYPDYAILPDQLQYLYFEATRGTKANANVLWNDKWNANEAGTPYTTLGLQNVYELDTLQGTSAPVPEAGSLWMWSAVLGLALLARGRTRSVLLVSPDGFISRRGD
ncbi:MAG: hypothetical protein WD894_23230 [Pirellulales bacterium]